MTEKDLKEKVVAWLQARPRNAYKTKDLARSLHLSKQGKEYQLLKAALRELQQEDEVERIDGRKWSIRRSIQEVVGTIEIAGNGHGFVLTHEEPPRTIFIHKKNLNRARGGDIVRVSVYPYSTGKNDEGAIEEIMGRPSRQLTGRLKKIKEFTFFEADDKRIDADIVIQSNELGEAEDGDMVVVEIPDGHERTSTAQRPKIVEILGPAGDVDSEIKALARSFGLQAEFSKDVEDEASAIATELPEKEIAKRTDLRDLECFTIDPDTAKDFDDAVSLSLDDDGNYYLGVHIADVSYYVQPGTKIDTEARKRGTSVYLVNHVIPMLPERLSNHMCSLKEGKDRFSYTVFMTITPRGKLLQSSFHKSVINSSKRFTYSNVQQILEGDESQHKETLQLMDRFAQVLTAKRIREGAIDFDLQEVSFEFDSAGHVIDMKPKERLMSMRMIEEFMLMANKAVAESIKGFGKSLPFMYRVHDLPDPDKVQELTDFMVHLGVKIPLNPRSSKSFQRMFDQVKGEPEEAVIHSVTVRSMAKAVYSEKNIGHFGLGFAHYSHFTSPIRRYPDLIVHRMLWGYQQSQDEQAAPKGRKDLKELALHCSARERLAVDAERKSVKLKQVEFMERHVGQVYDAVINGVTSYGIYVGTLEHMAEGLVHVRDLQDDYYEFNSKKKALIGQRRKRMYRMGDSVRVQVVRVDKRELEIDFVIQEDD
jgi:ribonuclease R